MCLADGEELHGNREVVAIEHFAVEASVNGIINVEFQLLAHFEEHGRRLDGNEFVVYVRLDASQSHIREHRLHVVVDGAALAVVLDEQRSRALVYIRCREQINGCHTQGDDQGKDEPFPSGKAEIKEVLQADEIICLVAAKHLIRSHLIRRIRILYHY